MTDQVLDILKLVLLALLYLFFARVLWAVWSEVRQPDARSVADHQAAAPAAAPAQAPAAPPVDGTPTGGMNWRANQKPVRPARGQGGRPARLVVLEPKDRRGTTFAIGESSITIGRETTNTIVIADDAYVSGHHATIALIGGDVLVDDVVSKNGTYVNGTRVDRQRILHIGDRVQVGATILEAQ
ncbi:MAG: FHA domain-containing protein [Ilumatobacter sp.]|nr:FHA domain-containing protein [Ilumatobacter sp.]